ncbi:MAG: hypothetical protein H7A44_11620 [Opitutaceae bacterium]|nr:hypothetical protein [Opitutaceae bacterium]
MDYFLIHCTILIWVAALTARRFFTQWQEQLLAAWALIWGNVVLTALLTAAMGELGASLGQIATSSALGLVALFVATFIRLSHRDPVPDATDRANPLLTGWTVITLIPLAFAVITVASAFAPNNPDALAWRLPRAMYYLGQGSLAPFETTDLRQILLPFYYDLVQVLGLMHAAPLPVLNFFNVSAWLVAGVATHRLCRLHGVGANAAVAAAWLAMVSLPTLAQASALTVDLPAGAGLLVAMTFARRWATTRAPTDAAIATIAGGLAAGSSMSVLLAMASYWGVTQFIRRRQGGTRHWGLLLGLGLVLPWMVLTLQAGLAWPIRLAQFLASTDLATFQAVAWRWTFPIAQPADLFINEDTVPLGLAAVIITITAFGSWFRQRSEAKAIAALSAAAGCWLATLWLVSLWIPLQPRVAIPPLLALLPGAALTLHYGLTGTRHAQAAGWIALSGVLAISSWSAWDYLDHNSRQPVRPVLTGEYVPAGLPSLPLLLENALVRHARINVDTDGTSEAIFPLMITAPGQRFTSSRTRDPEVFNLLSRAASAREASFASTESSASYIMVAFERKPTAGVELLASYPEDQGGRDYFGIEPKANENPPSISNRTVLVTLERNTPAQVGDNRARIHLVGLNPRDHAKVIVEWVGSDDSVRHLHTFHADGSAESTIAWPFKRLEFKVLGINDNAPLGIGAITDQPRPMPVAPTLQLARPKQMESLFVSDVVISNSFAPVTVDGLLPVEGPFPQWGLPVLRWARQPRVRLVIPPIPNLTHLQLALSTRVHVRRHAALEIWFNGEKQALLPMSDKLAWYDLNLDLTPQTGENVIELRDGPINRVPDWLGYLEDNPDVKAYVESQRIPLEEGARAHYEEFGRHETRMLKEREVPEPAPDGYYFMFRNLRVEGFRQR